MLQPELWALRPPDPTTGGWPWGRKETYMIERTVLSEPVIAEKLFSPCVYSTYNPVKDIYLKDGCRVLSAYTDRTL